MTKKLSGKVALVTGGLRALGAAPPPPPPHEVAEGALTSPPAPAQPATRESA